MFSKYFTVAALVAVASAAPLVQRGCTEGQYNCFDGKTYAQCISGGTWGTTMQVAPGTTCNTGISINPFIPGDSSSGGSGGSPPPPPPPPAPTTVDTPPASTGSAPPPPPPPPPPASTTAAAPSPTQAPPPPSSTTAASAPAPTQPSSGPSGGCTNDATQNVFADESCWLSWEAMEAKYKPIMGTSCKDNGWGANNSPDETSQVIDAIKSFASKGSVDPRFVLSLVMQESAGCVRVITTNNSVRNPGLLQDYNGSHSCNDAAAGFPLQNPCPKDQIDGMIEDGVLNGANNLQKAYSDATGAGYTGSKAYGVAARVYNSGSFNPADLAQGLGATGPYVDNILNRLVGTQQ